MDIPLLNRAIYINETTWTKAHTQLAGVTLKGYHNVVNLIVSSKGRRHRLPKDSDSWTEASVGRVGLIGVGFYARTLLFSTVLLFTNYNLVGF